MRVRRVAFGLLPVFFVLLIPLVQATTILDSSFDKETYYQGDTGTLTVTLFNDEETQIRVTELTATVDHYYDDGTVYFQRFPTNATLPAEIQPETSSSFSIPFSLPTNLASGYIEVYVKAITDVWHPQSEIWYAAEHPTDLPLLFVESPFKEQLDEQVTITEQLEDQVAEQQAVNDQLTGQLSEQQTINGTTTNLMTIFGVTTIAFAAVTTILFILYRRARIFVQPIA